LTAAGRTAHAELLGRITAACRRLADGITAEGYRYVVESLRRMAGNLERTGAHSPGTSGTSGSRAALTPSECLICVELVQPSWTMVPLVRIRTGELSAGRASCGGGRRPWDPIRGWGDCWWWASAGSPTRP